MKEIFADLHVHIGRSESGKPIKITGARSLQFANIAEECYSRKGIEVVGIIDCASPYVIEDIENFLKNGDAYELEDGGIIYKDKVCIILGSEVETSEINEKGKTGSAHNLCYFPHLTDMKAFSKEFEEEIRIAPIGYAADGQFKDAKIGNLHIVTETDNPDYYLFNTCMMIDKDVLEGYEKVYSFEKYERELCAIFEKK